MRIFLTLFLLITISACTRIEKNPELRDSIYLDIQNEIQILKGSIEAKNKELESHKKELQDVVPQTGQIKYVQKRIYEAESQLVRLEQELLYFELKKESQMEDSRRAYMKSLKTNDEWPNPKDYEVYITEKKLRRAKKSWDIKQRIEDLGLTPQIDPSPGH